jgi:hypothetical protein
VTAEQRTWDRDRYVEPFLHLFNGRRDVYGGGEGRVYRASWPDKTFTLVGRQHLEGVGPGLGMFPMLDTQHCWFGAIDLDEPNFEFARTLQEYLPRPTWLERSRSGNAHVWAFFSDPAPAWAVRGVFKAALEAHNRADVEVFPKQDRLKPGMVGNYINLPYHGNDRPMLGRDEREQGNFDIPFEAFLYAALENRQSADSWVRRARALGATPPEEREDSAEFGAREHLHECALYVYENRYSNPVMPGNRHDVLFAVAKQFLNWRAMGHDRARQLVQEIIAASPQPADSREVDRIVDTVIQHGYTSTGCDEPNVRAYVRPDCPIAHGD